jgi:hypothetical protein
MRTKFDIYVFIMVSINSDGYQFYQYQQNEHSSLTLTELPEYKNDHYLLMNGYVLHFLCGDLTLHGRYLASNVTLSCFRHLTNVIFTSTFPSTISCLSEGCVLHYYLTLSAHIAASI